MNKKKIISVIKALAEGVKGNAKLIKENQQAISKLTEQLNESKITQLPDADLKPGDVLLRQDPHKYFDEGARYIVTDDLCVKDSEGDKWPFLRKNKDLYVFGLDERPSLDMTSTACFVKAEDAVHG